MSFHDNPTKDIPREEKHRIIWIILSCAMAAIAMFLIDMSRATFIILSGAVEIAKINIDLNDIGLAFFFMLGFATQDLFLTMRIIIFSFINFLHICIIFILLNIYINFSNKKSYFIALFSKLTVWILPHLIFLGISGIHKHAETLLITYKNHFITMILFSVIIYFDWRRLKKNSAYSGKAD